MAKYRDYLITALAGPHVAGMRNTGVGTSLFLTEKQAEAAVRDGHILIVETAEEVAAREEADRKAAEEAAAREAEERAKAEAEKKAKAEKAEADRKAAEEAKAAKAAKATGQ